ncbi:MAG: GAF domain-containing protein [Planctomycetes bacterium]|nr:GAF domain-containing protein [Planctomycetota bacterium]
MNTSRRSEKQVFRLVAELKAVTQLTGLMTVIMDIETLAQHVVMRLPEITGCYNGNFFLFEGGELVLIAGAGGYKNGKAPVGHRLPQGKGIIASAAESGRPLYVPDVRKDSRYISCDTLPDTLSELAIPVVHGDSILGVIDIQCKAVNGFDDVDFEVLGILANQLAVSIQNVRLYEQSKTQAEDLAMLFETGQFFSSTLDHDKIMHEISRRCVELLDVDLFLLRLIENGLLVVKGNYYRKPAEKELIDKLLAENPIHIGEGIAGRVALTGEPAVSGDEPIETQTMPAYVDYLRRRKWLLVPMKIKDKTIGVLTFITSNPKRIFSPRDISLAQGIANQAAIAIENARLFDRVEKSEKYYRTILENSADAIISIDADLKIIAWSSGASRIFGYTKDEVINKSLEIIVPDNLREQMRHVAMEVRKKGYLRGWQTQRRAKDGSLVDVEITVTDMGDDAGYVAVLRDITERKSLEAQLIQSKKMEAIGRLAGGIAHDFNNLLQTILGFCGVLQGELGGNKACESDLDEIKKAGLLAVSLTRQLLAFSHKQEYELKLADLNNIVVSMGKMLRRLIGENINLITDLNPSLRFIKADTGQIEQVLMNLAVNAKDAMPDGGNLTVKTVNVRISGEQCRDMPESRPGEFVRLTVSDTGIGMDDEFIQHIFEPFFTSKQLGKGTGLGLSVVYGIIKQHGGWINVVSRQDKGSEFRIYLPVLITSEKLDKNIGRITASMKDTRGNGERILLVEDEEGVRNFIIRALSNNGYKVFGAGNAQEAMDVFKKEKGNFQLVFSDVVLPDENSLKLISKILSRKPKIKILLSSGYIVERSQLDMIHKQGFKLLHKPYVLRDLLVAVKEAVG